MGYSESMVDITSVLTQDGMFSEYLIVFTNESDE